MGDQVATPLRGSSHTAMRVAVCKDCQREIEALERALADAEPKQAEKLRRELEGRSASFTYPENDAVRKLDRGGSRSDRCSRHRQQHGSHIQGISETPLPVKAEAINAATAARPEKPRLTISTSRAKASARVTAPA